MSENVIIQKPSGSEQILQPQKPAKTRINTAACSSIHKIISLENRRLEHNWNSNLFVKCIVVCFLCCFANFNENLINTFVWLCIDASLFTKTCAKHKTIDTKQLSNTNTIAHTARNCISGNIWFHASISLIYIALDICVFLHKSRIHVSVLQHNQRNQISNVEIFESQTVKKCVSTLSRSSLWSENLTFFNSKLNISIWIPKFPTHLILEFTKHLIWNSEELLRNRVKKFNILQILQYSHSINGHLIKEHENAWNCLCWDWNKIGRLLSAMTALSKYLKVLWQAARLQDTWEPHCAREHWFCIEISDVNSCLV